MTEYRNTALVLNALFGVRMAISFVAYALIARAFGTSAEIDAFWIAVTPALVAINLIEACGIGSAATYYAVLSGEPPDVRRSELTGFVAAWLGIGLVLVVAIWATADAIVGAMVPGSDPAVQRLAARLLRLAGITLALGPPTYVYIGLLHGQNRFVAAAVIAALPATVLVVGQVSGVSDVASLTWWFVVGYGAALVATLVVLRGGLSLVPWRATYVRAGAFFRQFVPLLGGAVLLQLLLLRERALASHLEAGTISALTYGLRIATVAGGLVAAGFDATVAPAVARRHVIGDHAGARAHIRRALALVALLGLPLGLVLIVFAEPVVALLFGRGRFGAEAVALTAAAVAGYFGVYVWASLGRVLVPAAVGRQRALSALVISLAALLIYLVVAPPLALRLHAGGLALAASLAYACATALYAIDVGRR